MVGDEQDERKDQPRSGRPCFSRTQAPIGLYNGQDAIIVHDLRPVPLWPKYWIQALANHFHRQLNPAPKVDISVVDDCIRFSVFVSKDVSAEDLCKLDDAVYTAPGASWPRSRHARQLFGLRRRRRQRGDNSWLTHRSTW